MIGILLVLAVQSVLPTKAEVNTIIDPPTAVARRCVIVQSVKLDDGRSDAGSVADGAISACGREVSSLRDAVGKMINVVWGDRLSEQEKWNRRDKHMTGITETLRRLGTQVVLQKRQAN